MGNGIWQLSYNVFQTNNNQLFLNTYVHPLKPCVKQRDWSPVLNLEVSWLFKAKIMKLKFFLCVTITAEVNNSQLSPSFS